MTIISTLIATGKDPLRFTSINCSVDCTINFLLLGYLENCNLDLGEQAKSSMLYMPMNNGAYGNKYQHDSRVGNEEEVLGIT